MAAGVVAAIAEGRRQAAAAAAPPTTEVFRKSLREVKQLVVIISTPLHNGTNQPLDEFIQTFYLAVPAPRQYISTPIVLCVFYTLFQLRYFGRLWRAISKA
jgi:hypothetical protein